MMTKHGDLVVWWREGKVNCYSIVQLLNHKRGTWYSTVTSSSYKYFAMSNTKPQEINMKLDSIMSSVVTDALNLSCLQFSHVLAYEASAVSERGRI